MLDRRGLETFNLDQARALQISGSPKELVTALQRVTTPSLASVRVETTVSFEALLQWVSLHLGVSRTVIVAAGRAQPAWRARMAVCWGAREVLGLPLSVIGRLLGGRDHTSILHAVRRANDLIERDPAFSQTCGRMTALFGGAGS